MREAVHGCAFVHAARGASLTLDLGYGRGWPSARTQRLRGYRFWRASGEAYVSTLRSFTSGAETGSAFNQRSGLRARVFGSAEEARERDSPAGHDVAQVERVFSAVDLHLAGPRYAVSTSPSGPPHRRARS